ncbi:hypothetical protein AVEN_200447-1 [Araneus ventricosus]|uniref:RNase H type-1 domain-containing protein n=1 Tax=Araneus ventricosus TaxID=182803 RepID=A0A4Y2RUH7_ARAVE|nr:hypothetical protein AVEN_200447-1 [Araneus ventricosus]
MAQLKPYNSVFQAEPIAIKEADTWDIEKILLISSNIKLGWITAHAGNEAADLLAKKATLEGIQNTISSNTGATSKKKRHAISTQLWQNEWDNSDTGRNVHLILPKVKTPSAPWQRPEIMFAMGHSPFPTYLKRFILRTTDCCGCGKPAAKSPQQPIVKN